MSLNKIIFFLLLVVPRTKSEEQNTSLIMYRALKSWHEGHWASIRAGPWDTQKFVATCVSLSEGQCFSVQGSLMSLSFKQPCLPFKLISRIISFLQVSVARKSKCQGMVWLGQKSIFPGSRQVSIRAGTTLQLQCKWNMHLINVFNHLFGTHCLISVFFKLVLKSS